MKKSIFILGGTKSGKSDHAVSIVKKSRKKTAFIATCTLPDGEMKKRIKAHKRSRPRSWKVIEEGKNIASVLTGIGDKYELVLIDCLGLWVSNLLCSNLNDKAIEKEITRLVKVISKYKKTVVLVSNEVGTGIVPDNSLARRFRDLLGLANQRIACKADKVIFMQSGIPMIIKGGENA